MTDETSPYVENMKHHDEHEADMQRMIRDRGRMAALLAVILLGSVYSNAYQLTQAKVVPFIHQVDSHGQVVTTVLRQPKDIPADDPLRAALIKNYVEAWVKNARLRSQDRKVLVAGINSAIRMTAGPGLSKLTAGIQKEEVFDRVKRETVEVNMPKSPVYLAGDTWQAEWEEVVNGASNMELRREQWSGSFQLAAQDSWITDKNPLGLRVVNWSAAPFSK